ncbi:hypothetical protein FA743_12350 [Paracoccus gahaiensis]|uniref:Uncharacterized protein n=1 Tax=Paracoccus gahaiensis TaxID=1706839 RepID=A0A4U0R8I9_9RHOB|nr:hypothetical protein [Paracoccus gahaiensis]TJZ91307.1 hypothetical protein FA743_12350 [Paracoccus gahaiensis]
MEPHRLTLGRIRTDCSVMAGAEVAAAMGARIDRTLREDLPAALAVAAEGVITGTGGVLRIRRVRVQLHLDGGADMPGLARLFADRIAAALKAALAGGRAEIRHWPDRDSYLAAYVMMRLALTSEAAWAFPDLAALEHLPAERAAAELLRARPALLTALARAAAAQGDAAAPVAGWPEAARAALVRALLNAPLATTETGDLPPALGHLLGVPQPVLPGRSAAQDLGAALEVTLRLLAGGGAALQPRAMLWAAVAARAVWRQADHVATIATSPPGPAEPPGPDRALLDHVLAVVAADPQGRAVLDRFTRTAAAARLSAPVMRSASPPATAQAGSPFADEGMSSPRMGLGLLVPSVLLLDAAWHLGPTAMAQAVWQTLAPGDWPQAALDPALQMLLPVDPSEVDPARPQPVPPERLLRTLAPEARRVFEASDPDRRWSALILGDFASRLRGLQASSPAYLRRQFLMRPGTLHRGPDRITLRLDSVPLGILLRMAGFPGRQGRLPQPGQPQLVLDLGDAP